MYFKRRLPLLLRILALAMLLIAATPARPAAAGTLSQDLQQLLNSPLLTRVPVIVQTNGAPTNLLLSLVSLLGGQVTSVFTTIDGFAANLPLGLVTTLLGR